MRDTDGAEDVTVTEMRLSNGLVVRSNGRTPVDAMFTEIFRTDAYTPTGIPPVGPDGIVVDIGASAGLYTLLAARRWPHAPIHAVEPAPDTFALLVTNVASNSLADRVVCHNLAVAGHTGTAPFALSHTSACDTLVPVGDERDAERIMVRTTTLDDLFDQLPSSGGVHLKVDAEGSEFDLFEAASMAALDRIVFLALECHDYLVPDGRVGTLRRVLESSGIVLTSRRSADEFIVYGWRERA